MAGIVTAMFCHENTDENENETFLKWFMEQTD